MEEQFKRVLEKYPPRDQPGALTVPRGLPEELQEKVAATGGSAAMRWVHEYLFGGDESRYMRKSNKRSKMKGKLRAKDADKWINAVAQALEDPTTIWNPLVKDTEFLRRGALKTAYPNGLPDEIKAALLFQRDYPTPANPYEMGSKGFLEMMHDVVQRGDALDTPPSCVAHAKYDPKDMVGLLAFVGALSAAMVAAILYCHTLWRRSAVRGHDEEASEHTKSLRQRDRGTIASVAVAFIFGLVNFGVDFTADINAATSTAMIGMTLGGALGFVADSVFGSDVVGGGSGRPSRRPTRGSTRSARSTR